MGFGPFDASNYLRTATAPITALPCTLACWFYANTAASMSLLSLADVASNRRFSLRVTSTLQVQAQAFGATFSSSATTTATAGTGAWHHACGRFIGNNSRAADLDGQNKATNTGNQSTIDLDRIGIGHTAHATPGEWFDGLIAECALYDVALTDAEVLELGSGVSPLLVRAVDLVWYRKLIGPALSQEGAGGDDVAMTGTAPSGAHPQIVYPPVRYWSVRRRAA